MDREKVDRAEMHFVIIACLSDFSINLIITGEMHIPPPHKQMFDKKVSWGIKVLESISLYKDYLSKVTPTV